MILQNRDQDVGLYIITKERILKVNKKRNLLRKLIGVTFGPITLSITFANIFQFDARVLDFFSTKLKKFVAVATNKFQCHQVK